MKAKEIDDRLNNGEKLIYKDIAYSPPWYYVGEEKTENRINKAQFEKAKATCKYSEETEKSRAWFRDSTYRCYYWRINLIKKATEK